MNPDPRTNTPECWLVRHGETAWSLTRQHTGRSDIPLTEAGEQSARATAGRLSGVHFDLVLASPLQRAWRTAHLAGLDPKPEPDAVEWDYGDYEGRSTEDIREQRPDWSIWRDGVPGGETLAEVAARADQVVERVRAEATTRAVLVAHAHFIRIFTARWLGRDPGLGEHFVLDTASISVLGFDRGASVIQRWNS